MIDTTFHAMGCEVRLIADAHAHGGGASARADNAAADAHEWLRHFDATLSRFDPSSELSRLNADPRATVPASRLLRAAIAAGLWAAEQSAGLVDPTLAPAIERAGYTEPWATRAHERVDIREALATAPAARPAAPAADARWRRIHVDDAAGTVTRPPGIRIDTGGFGKGLAADALAHRLRAFDDLVVDCAGDIRVRSARPQTIQVEHPLRPEPAAQLVVHDGAVATSGISRRIWRRDGTAAHHLLDPSTGEPAWTGLLQATALAPTALEAETLAKAALLSGPDAARAVLARHGGVTVTYDGCVALIPAPVHALEVAA